VTAVDPRVSVVIPCHSQPRWPQLVAAVESVRAQRPAPAGVVVAVDNNPDLLSRARRELTGVTVTRNEFARGAAGTRNTGVLLTDTEFVALLDDDARARPGWLAGLLAPFEDRDVVGTGGTAVPDWQATRPRWFPDELLWTVGASPADAPSVPAPARNVWSVAMAVRRTSFEAVGGFRVDFTKVGTRSRPEDTDLCLRMGRAGGRWVYVPDAVVDHLVPPGRARLRYVLTRSYHEGRGKISIARWHRGRRDLDVEWRYLGRTLPRAVGRELAGTLRGGDPSGLARAAVVVGAVAAAALGGAVEAVAGGGRTSPGGGAAVGEARAAVLAPTGAEVTPGTNR
jgi:glucosyl-dolichyl phosphate glucuronosyltransferase